MKYAAKRVKITITGADGVTRTVMDVSLPSEGWIKLRDGEIAVDLRLLPRPPAN